MLLTTLLFLGSLGPTEIILIALLVLVLFGARRIPEFMRGLGQGVREFKSGMNTMKEEVERDVRADERRNQPTSAPRSLNQGQQSTQQPTQQAEANRADDANHGTSGNA